MSAQHLGYVQTAATLRAQAVVELLAREDADDEKRAHVLTHPGNRRQAAKFIRRCQRVYLAEHQLLTDVA